MEGIVVVVENDILSIVRAIKIILSKYYNCVELKDYCIKKYKENF
jgi:hypothetical protein